MKKRTLIACAAILFCATMPRIASATEYCELVNGDGKSFGSEIACGEEHFYVIDSTDDQIRALAKYSLNVGVTKYSFAVTGDTFDEYYNLCFSQKDELGYTGASLGNYFTGGAQCTLTKPTRGDDEPIRQLEEARGAHWDENGNYLYPQIGDVFVYDQVGLVPFGTSSYNFDFGVLTETIQHFVDEGSNEFYPMPGYQDYQLNLAPRSRGINDVAGYVYEYKNSLTDAGYSVINASLLAMSDLNNIATSKGHPFDYNLWGHNSHGAFSIDRYFDEEDAWLWDRTYWLRTGDLDSEMEMTFVDARGEICSTYLRDNGSFAHNCSTRLKSILDTGVRPLMILENKLQYKIEPEQSDGGEIEVLSRALGGDTVTFRAMPKSGYRLAGITLIGGDDEKVELSADEIENSSFVMPFANITIATKWEPIPNEEKPTEDLEPVAEESDDSAVEEPETETKPETIDENPNTFDGVMLGVAAIAASVLVVSASILALRRR